MKKIGILFLSVGLMGLTGLAAEAAAPVTRTLEFRKEMMEWRSYAGVWEERHYDETLTLSFASNGWGVFDYRGLMLPFAWKADGKGNIEGYDKKLGGRKVFDVTYVPEEDVMDCGFGTNKSQLGFTGRCAFKSEKLSDEVVRLLTEVQRPAPLSREEEFEQLKKSGDPRLKQVTNLGELMHPTRLLERRESIRTVDLEYPRVITDECLVTPFLLQLNILYGAHEPRRIKKHEELEPWVWARTMKCDRPSPANEIGIPQEQVEKALTELNKEGICADWFYHLYGSGRSSWREDGIYCYMRENERDKVMEIVRKYLIDDRARYILVEKVPEHLPSEN